MWGFQDIMVYLIGLAAVAYLIKRILYKKKKSTIKACGKAGCACH